MAESRARLLQVRAWAQLYENNRSRELGKTSWFPIPNDLSAYSYVETRRHADGAAHFGVWNALLMVASKAKPRGLLIREDGQPYTAESLARVTRLPHDVIEACIARLLEIGLLETGDNKPRKKSTLSVKGGVKLDHWGGEELDHFTGGSGCGLKDLRGRLERRPATRLAGSV